eukprot:TRINITY_DN2660_c0_g1_i5.p1 TRINITY_DN2660_c0_g1~~TRINITY_DN2660_c0_g1_i5.p1  ORF type:complete len:285 (+),score=99.17 TRINITY_DN2660_c0_g1_i5:57-911(+)
MSGAGKVAVVTGASSGIGAHLAARMLADGWSVALVARSVDKMHAVVAKAAPGAAAKRAFVIGADLSDMDQTRRAAREVTQWVQERHNGRLDVLVNNAGAGKPGSMEAANAAGNGDCGEANLLWHLQLNTVSVFVLTTALKDVLIESQKTHGNLPSVVNVGSIAGLAYIKDMATYCMAKAALHSFTKSSSLELAPHKVRMNAIAPATVVTNFPKNFGMTDEQQKAFVARSVSAHPIGRVGTPHDTTEAILFLADSARSGWITGDVLRMDGGRCLPLPTAYTTPKL